MVGGHGQSSAMPLYRPRHVYYTRAYRKNYKLATAAFIITVCVVTTLVVTTKVLPKSKLPAQEDIRSNNPLPPLPLQADAPDVTSDAFILHGTKSAYATFTGLGNVNKSKLLTVELRFVNVDAKLLTSSLDGCLSLTSLILDRILLLSDQFMNVFLPKLSRFYVDRTIGFHDQYRDYVNYTKPEILSSLLFFSKRERDDKGSMTVSDRLVTSVIDETDVTICYDGWTVISNIKESGPGRDLILALPYSDELLTRSKQVPQAWSNITSLTLTECQIQKSSVPSSLIYLNVYNVEFTNSSVTEILEQLPKLKTLFLEAPKTSVKLSSMPQSLETLSLTSVNLTGSPGDKIKAQSLALGSVKSLELIHSFPSIFPNVQNVSVFESINQHELLTQILSLKPVHIFMANFGRKPSSSILTPLESDVETLLRDLQISPTSTHFMLERNGDFWKGRDVSDQEMMQLRYILLGWDKYLTIDSYGELK